MTPETEEKILREIETGNTVVFYSEDNWAVVPASTYESLQRFQDESWGERLAAYTHFGYRPQPMTFPSGVSSAPTVSEFVLTRG